MLELLKQCKYVERSSGERKQCPECVCQKRHRRGYISVACAAGHTWVWCQYCCDCAGNVGNGSKQGCTNAMHWFERDSFDTGSRNHMQRHKVEAQCNESKKRPYISEPNTSRQPRVVEVAADSDSIKKARPNSAHDREQMVIVGVPQFLKDEGNVSLGSLSTYYSSSYNNICSSELSCKRFRLDQGLLNRIQLTNVVLDNEPKEPSPCRRSSAATPSRVLPPISEIKSSSSSESTGRGRPPTLAALFDQSHSHTDASSPPLHDVQASSPSTTSSSPSPASSPAHEDLAADYADPPPAVPAYLEQQIAELDSVGNAAFALVALRRAAAIYTC